MCALNYQIQPKNIRRIPFKAMSPFFPFYNPLPARAAMTDAARQAYNAKARRSMAIPENVRKARERRRKVSVERSAIVPVVHGRMQKVVQHYAFLGKEISDGVCEILALEHTDDSIWKLVDVMW